MQTQVSNIISVPSKISDNNHELVLEDLIYINQKSYSLNFLSPRPSIYFQIQHTSQSITISARHQSPNQLLCLLTFYILLSLQNQKQCIQFIKKVTYSQNIIQLFNPSTPKYYLEKDIVLATRTYLSKIIDQFSKLSIEERLMLEPNEYTILNVWIVVLRNILFRTYKDQNFKNNNSVITKSNIDKLVKIIKIKPSGFIRLIVDRKAKSMIVIDKGEGIVNTERRLVKNEHIRQQIGSVNINTNIDSTVGNGSVKSNKWDCCCSLI